MRYLTGSLVAAFAVAGPAHAQADMHPCTTPQPPRTVTVSVAGTQPANGPDWSTTSLDVAGRAAWCNGRWTAGVSRDARGSLDATMVSAGASGSLRSGATWEASFRVAVDSADFSARNGASARINLPFRFQSGPIGGLVLGAEASRTAYRDLDLTGIGVLAELYPVRTPGWITLSANSFDTGSRRLPAAYRVRVDWPVSEQLRVFGWTGVGYEETGSGLEEVQTVLFGARQAIGNDFQIQVNAGYETREILGRSETLGLSLSRSF
jgi:hypothetical protein